tara:strand:- start:1105 stop:1788 length:684 start_codon:yes stop_codon:yes gene_type:complete
MKKFYKIVVLLIALIFLTTYSPSGLNIINGKKSNIFRIKNIEIVNNKIINKNEIDEKLSKIYEKNIFFIKEEDIKKPLKSINFLKGIEVKKKYPNTIILKIYETKPVAILFKKNDKFLLDSMSNLILADESMYTNSLPNVFGDGAESEFIDFFNKLKRSNFPRQRIKNFYYFQIGRWDLELLNNQLIKYPASETEKAIQQSIELLNHKDFKSYNLIDLRVLGKIVVE